MKPEKRKTANRLYVFAFVVMAFTGFCQMPHYNQYYQSQVTEMKRTPKNKNTKINHNPRHK